MRIKFVKSIKKVKQASRGFYNRVRKMHGSILYKLAQLNESKSKQIADNVKFRGTLISSIALETVSKLTYRVIASAPHAYGIEVGLPEERGWVSFNEHPLLEMWVREKLMGLDEAKAAFFLRKKSVLVGEQGYPYGYPQGLQFMKLGFEYAVDFSDKVVAMELAKLGTMN